MSIQIRRSAAPRALLATGLLFLTTACASIGNSGDTRPSSAGAPDPVLPQLERFPISITSNGITRTRWVQAERVEEVLSSVPGLVVRARGTDDLLVLLRGRVPLVIIDGAEALPGDLRLLYPWEIAAVEVRRDVPSTAIFGARGESGVVLVTTKRTKGPVF
ncbi:MAG TPA: TonB-dependent receptor plug domain-containing protein [Longimicrobiaceae bacterium]